MSNTLAVLNNVKGAEEIEMLSPQVVDMINGFRAEEGNRKVLRHKDFLRSTGKEIEALKNAGVEVNGRNISLVEYTDKKGEKRPCYRMNRFWIMQMCNKESALVRYKTQQYIEALENRLKQQQISADQIKQMIDEAVKAAIAPYFDRIEKLTAPKETPKTKEIKMKTPYSVTKIAKLANMSRNDVNPILRDQKIISGNTRTGWVLNKEYEEAGWGITNENGGQYNGSFVMYSKKGKDAILKILSRVNEQEQLNLF